MRYLRYRLENGAWAVTVMRACGATRKKSRDNTTKEGKAGAKGELIELGNAVEIVHLSESIREKVTTNADPGAVTHPISRFVCGSETVLLAFPWIFLCPGNER